MEDLEKIEGKQEETVTHDDDVVTDEQLEAAYAAISGKEEVKPVVEEKKEETPVKAEEKTEEKKEEAPVVSDELKKFQERVAALEAENEKLKASKVEAPVVEEEEEQFLTNKNLDEVLTRREQKKQEAIKKANLVYQRTYESGLAKLAETVDKDLFPEIFETMTANNGQNEFNQRPTGRADLDVKLNFANAKAHVYQQRAGKVTPNLSPVKTDLATGLTVNNRGKPVETKAYQFDEHAQSLLKNSGLTDDDIKEAMEGPATFLYGRTGR